MPDLDPPRIISFGSFEADVRSCELRKSGSRVRLQQQPFQILIKLLRHKGEVVTREELRQQLWPKDTFVDFDHSLNAAIKRLRDALGESAENPVFIETLARRGYRFIAPVDSPVNGASSDSAIEKPKAVVHTFVALLLTGVALLGAFLFWVLRPPSNKPESVERRLTANSKENPLNGAAISPDGLYLAYSDSTGLYLKLIRTGETHLAATPPGFSGHVESWFPDGAHLLVSRVEKPGMPPSLWSIPVVGGAPRQLADNGWGASVSPDGAHIVFLRGAPDFSPYGREAWVTRSDGSEATNVVAFTANEGVTPPVWSPDGRRIAYVRIHWTGYLGHTNSVELEDWQSLKSRILFEGPRLGDSLSWLPDGRLVYTLVEPTSQMDSNAWVVSVSDLRSPSDPHPVRLTRGPGWVTNIRSTADGRVLGFVRKSWQYHVYLGTLGPDGKRLLGVRRLTLDDNSDIPFSWTPDSKAVVFASDRNGAYDIFKQEIDQPLPEPLVTGPKDKIVARLNPESTELLYVNEDVPTTLFAVPLRGGVPRRLLRDAGILDLQCSRAPSTLCVYSTDTAGQVVIHRFDASSGESSELTGINSGGLGTNWSLSPDGSELAIIVYRPENGVIQLRSTSTGATHDLIVKGRTGLMTVDWSADGNSLFVTTMDPVRKTALFRITLEGTAYPLLEDENQVGWAIPSPDGRSIAINKGSGTSNAWSLENF
jgi:DNA-binding winged helix-turn-helix (wHTH) protein/Tol biopolymer transport system component